VIGNPRRLSVKAYGEPVDMRRGFDGLSALVREEMREEPLSGSLYLFVSRNRRRAKVLLWDGTGLCVYAKRLEQGRFTAPWMDRDLPKLTLTVTELELFLEGVELEGRLPLSRLPFEVSSFFHG
jgi:transposase